VPFPLWIAPTNTKASWIRRASITWDHHAALDLSRHSWRTGHIEPSADKTHRKTVCGYRPTAPRHSWRIVLARPASACDNRSLFTLPFWQSGVTHCLGYQRYPCGSFSRR